MAGQKVKPLVTHIIFDFDGLLADTETLYTIGTQKIVSKFGKNFTWDIKVKMMGKREEEGIRILLDELQLPLTVDEFITEITKEYENLFPSVQLMPGVQRLVDHFYQHGISMAIATGSIEHYFNIKTLNHQNFLKNFHHVVFGNDPQVKNGKPAPDIFLVCASRFEDNPQPHQILVFEDAPHGVEAAMKAGMNVVMVPDPQLDPKFSQNADKVLNSLEDFKPEHFGLPAFT